MPAEQNKAIFLRFLDELRKGNLDIIEEVCSSNFTFYSPNYPNWPRGFEGARKIATMGAKIFSNAQSTVEDIFAEGDKMVVRWTIRGIYKGEPKPGFPKPGEQFAMGAMSMYRFANGKIEEDWGVEAFSAMGAPWA
jgi:predicted ester cyclase